MTGLLSSREVGLAFFHPGGDGFGEVGGFDEGGVPERDVVETVGDGVILGVVEDFLGPLNRQR